MALTEQQLLQMTQDSLAARQAAREAARAQMAEYGTHYIVSDAGTTSPSMMLTNPPLANPSNPTGAAPVERPALSGFGGVQNDPQYADRQLVSRPPTAIGTTPPAGGGSGGVAGGGSIGNGGGINVLASRGYSMSRRSVGAAGNDMLGVGNADYQSELIKGLRQNSQSRMSTNPGVTLMQSVPLPSSGGGLVPGAGAQQPGGVLNPPKLEQDAASADQVAAWTAYQTYRTNQLSNKQPIASFAEWQAQQAGNGTTAPSAPTPTAPPPIWTGDHPGL